MRWDILKRKNVALLVTGSLVSYLGTLLQNFALSLYVLKITGSGTQFASVLTVAMLPRILLGPFMGVLADRFDRKRTIVGLDFLSGLVVMAGAASYFVSGELSMGMIYFMQLALTIISVLFEPSITSVMPSIIEKSELIDVNSVKSILRTLIEFTAPILGGVLIGFTSIGVIMVINALSFISSAISEMFIDIPKRAPHKEALNLKTFFDDFAEGFKFAKRDNVIMAIIFGGIILNFSLGGLFEVGLAFVLKEVLHVTDGAFGFFLSITLLGMLIAPFAMTSVFKKIETTTFMALSFSLAGIITILMGGVVMAATQTLFSNWMVPYVILAVLTIIMIIFIGACNIVIGTMLQQQVPIEMMGRVSSMLGALITVAMPFGQMLIGVCLDYINPGLTFCFGGIVAFISGGVLYQMTKEHRAALKAQDHMQIEA